MMMIFIPEQNFFHPSSVCNSSFFVFGMIIMRYAVHTPYWYYSLIICSMERKFYVAWVWRWSHVW